MNVAKAAGARAGGSGWGAKLIALLLALIGLWLTGGGAWLLALGGSPYYLLTGLLCLASAWFYWRGRPDLAFTLYLLLYIGTLVWASAEVGADYWQLLPRLVGPTVFLVILVVHRPALRGRGTLAWGLGLAATILFVGFVWSLTRLPETSGGTSGKAPMALADDWTAFGRDPGGSRFAPAGQITPANVGRLQVAWTLRTGDIPSAYPGQMAGHVFEATPLKLGDLVYVCTPHNEIVAVDAASGKPVWRYDPKLAMKGVKLLACRGVSHFQTGAAAGTPCASRLLMGTLDARLVAVDALTGKPCADFGKNGQVALRDGLGVAPDGFYVVTSPPAIVAGVAVVGGFVLDGEETKEPSGVVRGYDATTGALRWSWDSGAKDENRVPKPGEHYSRGSPNSWTVMSADPELGLVYVPMGNATPDYVGLHRSPEDGRYSSSVVALDAKTGQRRWHFQAVHHDIWDYDIGSQPVLFDMPMPSGGTAPALAQPTKQGDIYILDRRTGKPLTQVIERRVPAGKIPGEQYSPTQPVSVGFPSPLTKEVLEERDMWGATPLDQLWCRIRFRSVDYSGRYTPQSVRGALQYPSNFGIVDWGSVAIDKAGGTMLVNSSHLPMTMQLIPREQAEHEKSRFEGDVQFSPQRGTPYAARPVQMLSPLGIPCNAPPWGKITAIDLATRKVKWSKPFGTTADHAPLGLAVPGAPNIAGAVVTGGGVAFIGASIDDYIRAYDMKTGAELWRARLPAGGQAAPISYVAKNGRQYVVIAAGGHQVLGTKLGDYLIAYALPK
jgi:quinoprotein glucose dehydrogenase